MTSIEQELRGVAEGAFPRTPDVAAAVRARLEGAPEPAPGRWWRRRTLVVVLAVLVAAVAATLAVPQARSTVLDWFGIGGVQVQLVDRLPPVSSESVLQLGVEVPLAEAQRRVPFRILQPVGVGLGAPDELHVGHFAVDEVTLLYGEPRRVRLLITEVAGKVEPRFAGKLVGPGTRYEQLELARKPALWIEGAPHAFFFTAPSGATIEGTLRLARNTLIWQRGDVVVRIEGQISRARALRIARSLR